MIPQDFIDRLLARINIVDVVSHYVPTLKKAGANYAACCPFHAEKTPSFTVSESKGTYHCWGCHEHGNAINFVMAIANMPFVDAIRTLAADAGMEVPSDQSAIRTSGEKILAMRYARAHELLRHACEVYQAHLTNSPAAMAYVRSRGLSPSTIEKFQIGFAPNAWNTISGNRSYLRETVIDSGLGKQKDNSKHVYDRFRDRLMFPIHSRGGENVIGFGGRVIVDGLPPKYLNSPECLVFQKGDNLYGLKQALPSVRQNNRVFVVEGYMDCAMVSQHQVENVVATLGTAITHVQLRLLFRHSHHITFCYDGDAPGRNAAQRTAELCLPVLDESTKIDFMFIEDGLDPDEHIRQYGKDGFMTIAEQATPVTELLLTIAAKELNLNNGEGLARFLSRTRQMAEQISSPIVKLAFQKQVAARAGIPLTALLQMPSANTVSATAKLVALCSLHSRAVVCKLDTDFLARYLSALDQDFLFPLLATLKTYPDADIDTILTAHTHGCHITLIGELAKAASKLGASFDAFHEAKRAVETIRALDKAFIGDSVSA